jgi:hypothetical protein
MKAYLEQRLPKGETRLPVKRYFAAQDQIKSMQRYSTAKGESRKAVTLITTQRLMLCGHSTLPRPNHYDSNRE